MTPDTVEMVALDPAELAYPAPWEPTRPIVRRPVPLSVPTAAAESVVARARPRLGAEARTALRDSWRVLWLSRVLVWVSGIVAVLILGPKTHTSAFDPPGVTSGFGWIVDRLIAPAVRWDSAWYLSIAEHGYRSGVAAASSRAAFFPLYPMLVGGLGRLGIPLVASGMLISFTAFGVSLFLLHRLTTLELSRSHVINRAAIPEAARLVVGLVAFFPMSFFFSAVYSESLYLALSLGVFWSARHGRWAIAGALGALAAATRSAGFVLVVPLVLLYLYGPREDRPPLVVAGRPRWWPRYAVRRDALWVGLVPLGLLLYMGYFALEGGGALVPFHAQAVWDRSFAGPVTTIWQGTVAAFDGLRQALSLQSSHPYFTAGHGNPLIGAQHNIVLFLFLLAAIPAVIGVLRTLPFAYGAYVLAALAMPLSYPVSYQPLMSLPRFLAVLFPLFMWGAARLATRPRLRAPVFGLCSVCLLFFVAQFATWHWVA